MHKPGSLMRRSTPHWGTHAQRFPLCRRRFSTVRRPTGTLYTTPTFFSDKNSPSAEDGRGFAPCSHRLLKKAGENFLCIFFGELAFSTR